jgi:hypothetical protein
LSDKEIAAFADYQSRLEPSAARRLMRAVNEDPAIMKDLAPENLREAIISSRDQLAALDMALHEDSSLISYGRIFKDLELVQSGRVGYLIFWDRYWPSVVLAAFIALLFLSWLRRLIFGVGRRVARS